MQRAALPSKTKKPVDIGVAILVVAIALWLMEKFTLKAIVANQMRNVARPAVILFGFADVIIAGCAITFLLLRKKHDWRVNLPSALIHLGD